MLSDEPDDFKAAQIVGDMLRSVRGYDTGAVSHSYNDVYLTINGVLVRLTVEVIV